MAKKTRFIFVTVLRLLRGSVHPSDRRSVRYAFSFSAVLVCFEAPHEQYWLLLGATKHPYMRVCLSIHPIRLHIVGGFGVLWSTAWPVLALVRIVLASLYESLSIRQLVTRSFQTLNAYF